MLLLNITASSRVLPNDSGKGFRLKGRSHADLAGGAWSRVAHLLIVSLLKYRLTKAPHGEGIPFLLWGNLAHNLVHNNANKDSVRNKEFKTSYPEGQSYEEGFCGTRCFGDCNVWLEQKDLPAIQW